MGQVSPPFDWQGLRIWASLAERGDPVLLTGKSYDIHVHVQRLTGTTTKGRLAFTWILAGQASTPVTVTFDLPTGASGEFTIPHWRPTRAGYSEFRLHLYVLKVNGNLESNLEVPPDQFGRLALISDTHTLFSSSVRDTEEWLAEKAWQDEQRKGTRLLILLAGLAAAAGIATVLLILSHF